MAERKVKKIKRAKDKEGPRKVNVYGVDGSVQKQLELPKVFDSEFRPDLISRASVSINANTRQPYSPKPGAGARHSVSTWGKGHGVSRVQRLKGSSKGAESPNNVGGRRAHPPRVETDRGKRMNRKEMQLARISALGAISYPERVHSRGHKFPEEITVPVVVDDSVEKIENTKDAVKLLEKLGLGEDLVRAENGKRIRAGRGKMRGRKYRIRKSLLVVTAEKCAASKSFSNILGVDVAPVNSLNVELLAPGGLAGRLTVMTESAFNKVGEWSR